MCGKLWVISRIVAGKQVPYHIATGYPKYTPILTTYLRGHCQGPPGGFLHHPAELGMKRSGGRAGS